MFPATFGEVDSPQLPTLFRDMSAVLGVARSAITSIHHCEKDLYTRKRKCPSGGDDEPPAAKSTSSTPPPTPGRITPLASPDIHICISAERLMPPTAPAPTATESTVIHAPTPTMAGAATQILVEEQLRGRISTEADLGPQQQPPRTSHDLSSDPSSEMYEPTGNEGAYPTYQPTRKSLTKDRISNLVSRAESLLLRSGGMPLIAPARRNWEGKLRSCSQWRHRWHCQRGMVLPPFCVFIIYP